MAISELTGSVPSMRVKNWRQPSASAREIAIGTFRSSAAASAIALSMRATGYGIFTASTLY
jgi:hypothetical protein